MGLKIVHYIDSMENHNTCCIFNFPPHYRKNIYQLMDRALQCDFYFGENVPGTLKEMDCSVLKGFKYRFKNVILKDRIIWQFKTLRLLFNDQYDNYILSADTSCLSEWLFLYGARLLGKKVLLWTHGWYGNESRCTKIRKKAFYLPANTLLLYSEYAQELMKKEGFKDSKLKVIANSLDYEVQKEIRETLQKEEVYVEHFKNSNPTIVFIGRLELKKRLSEILVVIDSLKKENKHINCVFIGDGNNRDHLIREAYERKIEKQIWFYGACYDEKEIARLLFNADICLSPGNVGLTSIHALSYGTPIITHNNFKNQMPEFEAISKGVNGDFFKEGDINDMKRVIDQWIQQHPSKTTRLINDCYAVIDCKYNPFYQMRIIKQALDNQ